MEFLFQVTLIASIRVTAETQAEAELKLRGALETPGCWMTRRSLCRSRLRGNWI